MAVEPVQPPPQTPAAPPPARQAPLKAPAKTELAAASPPAASPAPPEQQKISPKPIVLASLDEARFSIPMVRQLSTKGISLPKGKSAARAPKMTEDPTHALIVIDFASIPKALALLRELGADAEPMNSSIPAIMLAPPAGMAKEAFDARLVESGLFKPQSEWLISRP